MTHCNVMRHVKTPDLPAQDLCEGAREFPMAQQEGRHNGRPFLSSGKDQKVRVHPIEAEIWLMFKSTVPPVGPPGVISGPETVFSGT